MDTIALLNAAVAADPSDATARLALADAITEEAGAGYVGYYPELGEAKPVAHIEASLGHYGKHYFAWTPLSLKGRGIEHLGTEATAGHRRAGWNYYKVTLKAFEKLEAVYRISSETLLD